MKTEGNDSPVQMAHTRLSEGITLIFDQDNISNSASPPSRSRSRSSHHSSSHSSGSFRRAQRREVRRERHRSSSSTSSSSSGGGSSRKHPRSRSHPRCHRASSRSRCCRQHRHRNGHRSPPGHYRARSRSYSPSPSPDKSTQRRGHRSRSRSVSQRRVRRGVVGRCRISRSPSRRHETDRSRSRTSRRSVVSQSRDEKRELLRTAKANATRALRVDQLELPESVKAILGEREELPVKRRLATPEPESESEEWVRPEPVPQKSPTQQDDVLEPEDALSPKTSPKRKTISFTIHNSVAKPTSVFVPSTSAESYVTAGVESFTSSRRPYGHWVPVRKVTQTSLSHTSSKRSLTTSR